jgi:hypothetical protein
MENFMLSGITQNIQHKTSDLYASFSLSSVDKIAKKLALVAIPTIGLYALSNIPGTEAGPVAYATCLAACGGATAVGGPISLACILTCLPFLAAPTP